MKRKSLLWGALVTLGAVVALIIATGAFGFNSGGNPGATGANNIVWTGHGVTNGVLNNEECDAQNDPNGANQPYLLWILTVDGGSIQSDSSTPVLHLAGTGSGDYFTTNPSDNSSAHFVTPFFNLSGLTANADINVLTTGSGSWNLNISHGCSGGGRQIVAGPTVSKDANGTFDDTFTWDVTKSANTDTVYSAGGGESGKVTYTVSVHHGESADSNYQVGGTIDVNNSADGNITLDSITDEIVDGFASHLFDCTVDIAGGGGLTVAPGHTKYSYSCNLGDTDPGVVYNHVTIAWTGQDVGTDEHVNDGSDDFTTPDPISFTANEIDECVDVTDTQGGSLGKACVGDDNPKTFTYDKTFTGDPAGTCTGHDNTAAATGEDTGDEVDSNTVTVQDCQGADLTVSKTASGSYIRHCTWTIGKTADQDSKTGDAGQLTTFNYTVTLGASCNDIKNVKVVGTITVSNPNDWEDITLSSLVDTVDDGGTCTIDTSPGLTIPKAVGGVPGSKTYNYTCTYANGSVPAAGTNTATANWDAATYSTPDGTKSGTAGFTFTGTLTDDCVDVTDNYKGSLGHFCTNASGTITGTPPAVNPITYSLSFTGPAAGTCASFKNTATAVDNSTPQVTIKAYKTVQLCSFGPRFTPGYWKNHLAPTGSAGCNSLPSGTSCGSNGPFASAWTNSTRWKCLGGADNCSGVTTAIGYTGFKVGTIGDAAQVFFNMSCSFSGSGSNQNQQAIGCLAGKLLAAKYNININGSNPCIASVITLADNFLSPGHTVSYGGYTATSIRYTGPSGTYTTITSTGTSNNQRAVAIALQNALDAYDNGGGCH
jgi:hypothetical protein